MWHASIARWTNKSAAIPLERWGDGVRREARRVLSSLLVGVGQGEPVEHSQKNGSAVHWRRSLTDDEMCLLSAEWLALPARDEFSLDGLIETRL